eukprot:Skav229917  [mRNA]  locus=scaffold877:247611:261280:+ [translate_table: standard]
MAPQDANSSAVDQGVLRWAREGELADFCVHEDDLAQTEEIPRSPFNQEIRYVNFSGEKKDDDYKDLQNLMELSLQDPNILSPQERRLPGATQTALRQRRPEGEDLPDEGKKLMTLKHGLGNATAEHLTEPFVEALKPWPGVYKMLKKRPRKNDRQKWLRARLAEFIVFGIMMIFSLSCFFLRTELESFLLRLGVQNALVEGLPGQTSNGVFLNMKNVNTVPLAEQYLNGCFDYQLFNPQSTLRKFYTPVGDLRFRVQKAAERECMRPEMPQATARECSNVEVSSNFPFTGTQKTKAAWPMVGW